MKANAARALDGLGIAYVRGGVTALACTPYLRLGESAPRFGTISVSAGQRGLQVLLDPREYARATGARLGPIATAGP